MSSASPSSVPAESDHSGRKWRHHTRRSNFWRFPILALTALRVVGLENAPAGVSLSDDARSDGLLQTTSHRRKILQPGGGIGSR